MNTSVLQDPERKEGSLEEATMESGRQVMRPLPFMLGE